MASNNLFSKSLLILVLLFGESVNTNAQCPPNIDFEMGNFTGWLCYTGTLDPATSILNLDPSPPLLNRHTLLSAFTGNGTDYYGGFPQNCPNGSGYSVKLGNTQAGGEAERISYTFTIPATQNSFSLIYQYAVVLQDFGHAPEQQPKLSIKVLNLTDNLPVPCSSFDFVANGNLPGFFTSPNSPPFGTPIRCKDWAAASINLDGNAGKTIEVSFTTFDCSQGEHFGYAYIDINTSCSSSFIGASFCADDTAVNITAPTGYQNYKWYNSTFTQLLGTQQVLHLIPPPLSGSTVAVELTPFNGYGCKDTLIANFVDTLTVTAYAGKDTLVCSGRPVQLGSLPQQGRVYKWIPVTGLSNPTIANPIATVNAPSRYILTVTHDGGGCITTDTVNIGILSIDTSLQITGPVAFCKASGQTTVLNVKPADSIQWYRDNTAIPGAIQTQYTVTQSGAYYALLFSNVGCSFSTRIQQIYIYLTPVADFSVQPACVNLTLPLQNRTVNNSGSSVNYFWDFGNGQTSQATNPVYNYPTPGNFTIRLSVGTIQCPLPLNTTQHDIVIDSPLPGIIYPVKDAVFNFPEPLQARTFGSTVSWNPATGLNDPFSFTPFFKGLNPQLYTILIKTPSGCLTVDTQLVKTHKKIEIYVPTVFKSSSYSINNKLRPLLMGFDRVNYFRIYNRWGKLLFEMKSDQPGWDGKLGNIPQEIQTVVWMIEAIDVDGIIHHKQGTTVLMH